MVRGFAKIYGRSEKNAERLSGKPEPRGKNARKNSGRYDSALENGKKTDKTPSGFSGRRFLRCFAFNFRRLGCECFAALRDEDKNRACGRLKKGRSEMRICAGHDSEGCRWANREDMEAFQKIFLSGNLSASDALSGKGKNLADSRRARGLTRGEIGKGGEQRKNRLWKAAITHRAGGYVH